MTGSTVPPRWLARACRLLQSVDQRPQAGPWDNHRGGLPAHGGVLPVASRAVGIINVIGEADDAHPVIPILHDKSRSEGVLHVGRVDQRGQLASSHGRYSALRPAGRATSKTTVPFDMARREPMHDFTGGLIAGLLLAGIFAGGLTILIQIASQP